MGDNRDNSVKNFRLLHRQFFSVTNFYLTINLAVHSHDLNGTKEICILLPSSGNWHCLIFIHQVWPTFPAPRALTPNTKPFQCNCEEPRILVDVHRHCYVLQKKIGKFYCKRHYFQLIKFWLIWSVVWAACRAWPARAEKFVVSTTENYWGPTSFFFIKVHVSTFVWSYRSSFFIEESTDKMRGTV